MKTFRYKVINITKELNESKLNEFGRRGWELVSAYWTELGYTYYFKNEANE